MTAEKNPNEYIHNLARTLMGQLGIRGKDWKNPDHWPTTSQAYGVEWVGKSKAFEMRYYRRTLARTLYHRYIQDVESYIREQKMGNQGFVACCGVPHINNREQNQTSLADVCEAQFSTHLGGLNIVTRLAALSIIAAMTDNLIADTRKLGVTLPGV